MQRSVWSFLITQEFKNPYWLRNSLAKEKSGASGTQSPSCTWIWIRIRPEQIAHGSIVRHLLHPVNCSDLSHIINKFELISNIVWKPNSSLLWQGVVYPLRLFTHLVNSVYRWRESSVDTKDPIVNDGRETQVVKDLTAVSPNIGWAKLLKTLVVESIHFGDLSRLVVASDECNSVWVSDLQGWTGVKNMLGYDVKLTVSVYAPNVWFTFRASRSKKVSTLWCPLSTKSPIEDKGVVQYYVVITKGKRSRAMKTKSKTYPWTSSLS